MTKDEKSVALQSLIDYDVNILVPFVPIAKSAYTGSHLAGRGDVFCNELGRPIAWSQLAAGERRRLAAMARLVLTDPKALALVASHGDFSDSQRCALEKIAEERQPF